MRLLYLTRAATAASGREAFAGRLLYDRLAEAADDAIAAYIVAPSGSEGGVSLELLDRDVLTTRSYLAFDPHVIYFEGGLVAGPEHWRVPRAFLERSVRAGAIAVIAGAEFNELNRNRDAYIAASDFLGAQPNYGSEDSISGSLGPSPVYGIDRSTEKREFDVQPHTMLISDWLRPVYADIDRILAVSPVDILGGQDVLATGDTSNTATLQRDLFVNELDYCTFATIRQLGDGFVVFIAAEVSHDLVVERSPDNPRWILNTIRLLRAEMAKDARRYAGIRRLQKVVADTKRDAPEADWHERTLNHALDREAPASGRRASAEAARSQLSELFGPVWDSISDAAQRQLVAAEIYRHDAEVLADTEHEIDFSAAVGAYSRALEMELLRRLFEPYRGRSDADDLPAPRSQKREGRSLDALRRRLDGQDPSLGEMAFILMHVGCRLRDVEPNAFAAYLRDRLTDYAVFCDEACFPARLNDYVQRFRNRAMHVGELSADECKAARDYLFEEPVQLLVYLAKALGRT